MAIDKYDISAWRRLCDETTSGPWELRESRHGDAWEVVSPKKPLPICSSINADATDLEFITTVRAVFPLLLDELERLLTPPREGT